MSGVQQAVFQNQRSFALKIGDAFGGGFYAGQISTAGNSIADYNLVVSPLSTGQTVPIEWKTNTTGGDPSSVIDGPANSTAMIGPTYPAANFCENLTIGSFTDWYMPAKNELEVCYFNLKPTTAANAFNSGINANAVPARSSVYGSTGIPAQTSATNFQSSGTQYFSSAFYWSSTQYSNSTGCVQSMSSGNQTYTLKTTSTYRYVRAIRRVAV